MTHLNHMLIRQLMPEVIPVEPNKASYAVFQEMDLEGIYPNIHINDIMFLGNLLYSTDFNHSLTTYYKVGEETATQIAGYVAAHEQEHGVQVSSFLDFGSGYGRVGRFLPRALGPKVRLYASDVKAEASGFCEKYLGFTQVAQTHEASSFPTQERYDAIFAGSVFTHLQLADAEAWLDVLATALSTNGLLMFSTRSDAELKLHKATEFKFIAASEDTFFESTGESIKDGNQYGTAFIPKDLLDTMMKARGLAYKVIPNGFAGTQDYVLAWKA